ncbi:MAG: hypothetical protein AAF050_01815 [Cyanobacteria bacterium J06649_5]
MTEQPAFDGSISVVFQPGIRRDAIAFIASVSMRGKEGQVAHELQCRHDHTFSCPPSGLCDDDPRAKRAADSGEYRCDRGTQ